MFDCLENIIGVTKSDCPCILEGLTTEQKNALAVSKSKLYLDDLEGGISLQSIKDTSLCGNMADLALGAISNAVQTVSNDLLVLLNKKYAKNKKTYTGLIGSTAFSAEYNFTPRNAGVMLRPREVSDGVFTLEKVHLAWNTQINNAHLVVSRSPSGSSTQAIKIFETDVIVTVANGVAEHTLPSPLSLPLAIDGVAQDYFFTIDKTHQLGKPLNTSASCNCGNAEKKLKEFVQVLGVTGNEVNGKMNVSSYSGGIILEGNIRCQSEKFVCREFDENDAVSVCLAYATRFKAGELLIESVLASDDLNRNTMMRREYFWGKRNHFRKEYAGRMKYLENDGVIDIESTDCYICKDDSMHITGIIA